MQNDTTTQKKKCRILEAMKPRNWSLCCTHFYNFTHENHTSCPLRKSKAVQTVQSDGSSPETDLIRGYQAFQKKEYQLAKAYYEIAASQNNPLAQHNLGVMYLYGQGMATNYPLAETYFKLAACQNCTPSLAQLGYMYLYGRGCELDTAAAYKYFYQASLNDDPYALFQLGYMHLYNKAPVSSTKDGLNYLRRSMQQNYTPAIYHLGCIFMFGLFNIKANRHAAKALFTHAAHFGNDPYAQNNLGCLIAEDPDPDFGKSAYYFYTASKQQISEAYFNLGECHMFGLGLIKSTKKATSAYFEATKLGSNSNAEYKLGVLYLTEDLNLALYWLERATAKGNEQAAEKFDALNRLLAAPKSQRTPQFLASTKLFT